MSFEESLIKKAKSNKQRIVLPEGNDERILLAAEEILKEDFASLTILGNPDEMNAKAKQLGLNNFHKAELLDYKNSSLLKEFAASFYELRKAKGITEEQALKQLQDRNHFSVMMVYSKKADGMVSGADGTTADTIRPALSIIRTKPGCSIASSVFLMCLPDGRVWVFGDCAINPNPTPAQLAEIAIISAQTAKAFDIEPKVAMLSYSSGSSAKGADVDAVKEAVKIALESAQRLYPNLPLDGPLQFDAAVDPKTGASKMPNSTVAGQATVMIFPSLNAGNICYKAVQRAANALAIGPIIQGLNAPVNDLSRGALVEDIINTVAITALQAQSAKK
ncbi:MAG: phosphate acetyltransferase [Elusimicrobiota bacterium]|jgi:phosphate acetyltransferase|nr:phosphate acetyltransferase [Elusimicrobiota bacterium]